MSEANLSGAAVAGEATPQDHGRWWEPPRLRTDEDEHHERRVGPLELFYDLVFVVVIAELAHFLSEHLTLAGVLEFGLLFVPVWWTWIGGAIYSERFESGDLSYRLLTFAQMVPVAGMGLFVHNATGSGGAGFALSYAASRALIAFMWARGGRFEARFRPVGTRFATGFALSGLLFVASVFVAPPWRFALWGLGLFLDLATPATTVRLQARLPRLSTSRLPERFGLFVIIVLGEVVVGVVQGMAELETVGLAQGLTGALGLALAFSVWWVYFDFVARRPFKHGTGWALAWSYLHLPLVVSITAVGASLLNLVSGEGNAGAARLLAAGAVALALVLTGLLELTLRRDPDEPTEPRVSLGLKLAAAPLALGLGFLPLAPPLLLLGLLCLTGVQMAYGAYVWFHTSGPAAEAA